MFLFFNFLIFCFALFQKTNMNLKGGIIIFVIHLQLTFILGQPENLLQNFVETTNTILFHLNETIEDVNDFLPAYDFIVVGNFCPFDS